MGTWKRHVMRKRILSSASKRPVAAALVALAVAGVTLWGVTYAIDLTRWWLFTRALERTVAVQPAGTPVTVTWPVSYRRNLFRVSVEIYPSEIAAARSLDTAWVFGSGDRVRSRYVRSLIHAQADSRLVGRIAEELREIRDRHHLSDDEYLGLMAAAAQGIPYGAIGDRIAPPAEMLARGDGVCTEKTVLLGALMLREGWETAVFVLGDRTHVALGVGSEHVRFRTLPYAFVETTRAAAIGEVDRAYLAWGPVGDPPSVIAVGGHRRYAGPPPDAQARRR